MQDVEDQIQALDSSMSPNQLQRFEEQIVQATADVSQSDQQVSMGRKGGKGERWDGGSIRSKLLIALCHLSSSSVLRNRLCRRLQMYRSQTNRLVIVGLGMFR